MNTPGDAVSEPVATSCPNCGAAASGNFCASCGAPLGARTCTNCGTQARPGDRFCRGCGSPVVGAVERPREPRLPWVIAGILCALAVAAVVYAAGGRGQAAAPAMANAGNAVGQLGPAPDITNLTPKERFQRLNDRVMSAAENGDTTTVITFWPMAAGAYEQLLPGDRDIDTRYHMATLYLMVGETDAALALADTMMTESPDNLLGWYVRGIVAEYQQDSSALAAARASFEAAFEAEIAKDHEEYVHHADLLRGWRAAAGGN
jgi:hypothetical protein